MCRLGVSCATRLLAVRLFSDPKRLVLGAPRCTAVHRSSSKQLDMEHGLQAAKGKEPLSSGRPFSSLIYRYAHAQLQRQLLIAPGIGLSGGGDAAVRMRRDWARSWVASQGCITYSRVSSAQWRPRAMRCAARSPGRSQVRPAVSTACLGLRIPRPACRLRAPACGCRCLRIPQVLIQCARVQACACCCYRTRRRGGRSRCTC